MKFSSSVEMFSLINPTFSFSSADRRAAVARAVLHRGRTKNISDKWLITISRSYSNKRRTILQHPVCLFVTMQSACMHPAGHRHNQEPSAPINQDPLRHTQSVACQSEHWLVISMYPLVQKQPSQYSFSVMIRLNRPP